MDFRYPAEAEAFRAEVRAFLKEVVTPEYVDEQRRLHADYDGHGPATQRFVDALRAKGWLTLHWPKEYGGQGRSIFEQAVFAEEIARAGASTWIVGHVGLTMSGPALMHFGSEEQKRELLPKIASGEVNFCQLFSEPEAGSDLAALTTKAIRDGDDYLVTGTKIFTTWAYVSTHGYLLARTDPNSTRHHGLSLFVIDMKSPGVEIQPLRLISGSTHGITHLENVRVPRRNLVGDEGRGWYHAMVTFAFERAGIDSITRGEDDVLRLIGYARGKQRGGRPLSEDPEIRAGLIRAYRDVRISRALGLKVLDGQARGTVTSIESSVSSLHAREAAGRTAITKAKLYGMAGQLMPDSPYAEADGDGVRSWWVLPGRHAAGSIEIQKNIIAQRGLGMPR